MQSLGDGKDSGERRSKQRDVQLTKQDDDTKENCDERPCAQARSKHQGLSIAGLHVPLVITRAYTDRECASAALNRIIIVKDQNWQ